MCFSGAETLGYVYNYGKTHYEKFVKQKRKIDAIRA